jgi:hypothetical protein
MKNTVISHKNRALGILTEALPSQGDKIFLMGDKGSSSNWVVTRVEHIYDRGNKFLIYIHVRRTLLEFLSGTKLPERYANEN